MAVHGHQNMAVRDYLAHTYIILMYSEKRDIDGLLKIISYTGMVMINCKSILPGIITRLNAVCHL